jgi:membrane protease YdiL (CAAX protease family)
MSQTIATAAPASATSIWTPLRAAATGLAVLVAGAVPIFLLPSPRLLGLQPFQSVQLVAIAAQACAATVLAAAAMLAAGVRGAAGLRAGIGWNNGARAMSLSVVSGVAVAAIVHTLFVKYYGSAGYLSIGDFAWLTLAGVIAAPLVEEAYFRGVLLPALADRFGAAAALIVVTLASSAFHLSQMLYVMPSMALFGIIRLRTGSVKNCCIAHAVYNLCLALLVLR